jgi:hypothetical protein
MGIFMGFHFKHDYKASAVPAKRYPWGAYEDWDFVLLNLMNNSYEEMKYRLLALLDIRRSMKVKWGVKDPVIIDHIELYLELLDNPLFIHCTRPIKDCGSRTKRWRKRREKYYEVFGEMPGILTIEFNDLIYGDTLKEIERILEFVSVDIHPEDLLTYIERRSR